MRVAAEAMFGHILLVRDRVVGKQWARVTRAEKLQQVRGSWALRVTHCLYHARKRRARTSLSHEEMNVDASGKRGRAIIVYQLPS